MPLAGITGGAAGSYLIRGEQRGREDFTHPAASPSSLKAWGPSCFPLLRDFKRTGDNSVCSERQSILSISSGEEPSFFSGGELVALLFYAYIITIFLQYFAFSSSLGEYCRVSVMSSMLVV